MNYSSLCEIINIRLRVDESHQRPHIFRYKFTVQTLVRFFTIYHINCIVSIETAIRQTIPRLQIFAYCHLIQPIQVFFIDFIMIVVNELHTLLHTVNPLFGGILRSIAGQNSAHTFSGSIDIFDFQGVIDFVFRSTAAAYIGSITVSKENLCTFAAYTCNIFKVYHLSALEILQRRKSVRTSCENFKHFFHRLI